MNWAISSAMVLAFVAIFRVLRLVDRGREVLQISSAAVSLMRDPTASDLEKEKRIQRYSLRLLTLLSILVGGGVLALMLPVLVVWGLGALAFVDAEQVFAVATSVWFMVVAGVGTIVLFWWLERRGPERDGD